MVCVLASSDVHVRDVEQFSNRVGCNIACNVGPFNTCLYNTYDLLILFAKDFKLGNCFLFQFVIFFCEEKLIFFANVFLSDL